MSVQNEHNFMHMLIHIDSDRDLELEKNIFNSFATTGNLGVLMCWLRIRLFQFKKINKGRESCIRYRWYKVDFFRISGFS